MSFIFETILSVLLILYILIELVRIHVFKKSNTVFLAGFISLLLIVFGFYLALKYGLILDYGSLEEINNSKAEQQILIAVLNLGTGFFFLFISFLQWIIRIINRRFK